MNRLSADRVPALPAFVLLLCVIFPAGSRKAAAVSFPTSDGIVQVDNWGYQLQGPAATNGELLPSVLAAAPHDLIVMDFARYGDEASKFTNSEVASIQNGPLGRRIAASYISIGEASEFRSYWDTTPGAWTVDGTSNSALASNAPGWLGPVNPSFPESRKVRYWDPDWQDVIFGNSSSWLNQIVDQGFDAAYLDIVDAFFFWSVEVDAADRLPGDPAVNDEADAAARMIDFIVDMTAHARQTNPDFFTIPQNGAYILDALEGQDPIRQASYLDAIGAIGIEDLYYRGNDDLNNPLDTDTNKVQVLNDFFIDNDKPVFVVDYIDQTASIQSFDTISKADGFIPYAAPTRDLDVLGIPTTPGDYNGDGQLSCSDVDQLVAKLTAEPDNFSPPFDLDGDNQRTRDDLDAWIALKGTIPGDANLDGVVDASDFNVWNGSKFTAGQGWCGGDFSGDGVTDGSDFNIWNSNKFQSALVAVPEPDSMALLFFPVALAMVVRRSFLPSAR